VGNTVQAQLLQALTGQRFYPPRRSQIAKRTPHFAIHSSEKKEGCPSTMSIVARNFRAFQHSLLGGEELVAIPRFYVAVPQLHCPVTLKSHDGFIDLG
jgi:hypothetical protein